MAARSERSERPVAGTDAAAQPDNAERRAARCQRSRISSSATTSVSQ